MSGRNLEDHIGINYTYRANCPTINQQLGPWWGKLSAGPCAYILLRDGPLSVSLNQAGGFIRSAAGTPEAEHPALFPGLLHPSSRAPANARS